jgi:putative ABC transport system permease protein
MNLQDMINFTFRSLLHQKLRSFLTVLGIIVGISSVILLVGLVQGLKADILEQLEDFGPRTMLITPRSTSGGGFGGPSTFSPTAGKLFEKDYERVKRLPEIESITKIISGTTTVQFKDESISATVFGIEASLFDDTVPVEIDSGRFLEDADQGVAGIGHDIVTGFDEDVKTQSNLFLAGKKFKVIGTLKETGNSFAPIDNVIFIPIGDAEELFNESLLDNEISAIRLTLKEGTNISKAEDEITDIMLASHRVTEDEKDFGVISPEFINSRFTEVLDTITLFLGAIASISLIVGGIGISNTMFMSVLERRREIGTMKAVGATTSQIRNIFIVESSIIGLLGGILGLGLAVALGLLITAFEINFIFDPFVMTGAVMFSIVIGLISGTFPAIEAAKVDAMVALRYE